MKKNYLVLLFVFISFSAFSQAEQVSVAENSTSTTQVQSKDILGLRVYPNPTSSGYVKIVTTLNKLKYVQVFDLLGKRVIATSLFNQELDVTDLRSGIYILKVTEGNKTATRKLVVK